MREYIDRESLISDLKEFANEQLTPLIENLIQKQPTADVAEVRHGKWVDLNEIDMLFENTYECDYCNQTFVFEISPKECNCNYCPNCGAKMDGDDNAFNVKK